MRNKEYIFNHRGNYRVSWDVLDFLPLDVLKLKPEILLDLTQLSKKLWN